jgi:hypothetical protein
MTRHIKSTLLAVAILSFALVGCRKGPEGKYSLDKASMKQTMEAEIAKLPGDQQEMAKQGLSMIDSMDMTIELKKDGQAEFTMKMAEPGKPDAKSETKKGKWTQQEKKVTLEVEGESKKLECEAEGNKLTCKEDKTTMVFIRS